MDKNKIIKPLLLLVVLIIFCSVLSRVFSNSETLSEYAEKNPEMAYQETVDEENVSAENAPSSNETEHSEESSVSTQAENVPAKIDEGASLTGSGNSEQMGNHNVDVDNGAINNDSKATIDSATQESEDHAMMNHPNRVVYKDGFYYEPLSEDLKRRITGISYPVTEAEKDTTVVEAINIVSSAEDIQVDYEELCYMRVLYYNFKGIERTGELICNKAIAQDLAEIFYELYQNEYQIEQIRLVDEYSGDDTLSMMDNNTSCFNYRVVDGTSNLSKHAMGLAIDINPYFNPYVVYKDDGTTYISPQGSETYADRSKDFAYKIDENDLCYKLFKEHGFVWGGDWNSCKDYQHFQKVPE